MAKVNLTHGRISSFTCNQGQSFLWDSTVPGLGVRSTPGGKKAFILQSRFAGKAVRITLGDIAALPLEDARNEARRQIALIKQGVDPREQKRQNISEQEEQRITRKKEEALAEAKGAAISEAWAEYLAERTPRWSPRHLRDHFSLSQDGSVLRQRGEGNRKPGPLFPLMHLSLAELTTATLEKLMKREVDERPTRTRLALRLLQSFITWCGQHELYSKAIQGQPISTKVKELLPKKQAKADCLFKEQLEPWFKAVRQIGNPVFSAYLQGLLLTGARKEELASLQWCDVDFKWKSLTIKDKVEGGRIIPLTPYVESLLRPLPRRNQYVFSNPTSAGGRILEARGPHQKVLTIAGIEGLTLHGLRRSFGSLSEWVELPVGVVAQIMGHKPSATAERHYRVRPLDLLRKWHIAYESWILEQAGITAPVLETAPLKLEVAQ